MSAPSFRGRWLWLAWAAVTSQVSQRALGCPSLSAVTPSGRCSFKNTASEASGTFWARRAWPTVVPEPVWSTQRPCGAGHTGPGKVASAGSSRLGTRAAGAALCSQAVAVLRHGPGTGGVLGTGGRLQGRGAVAAACTRPTSSQSLRGGPGSSPLARSQVFNSSPGRPSSGRACPLAVSWGGLVCSNLFKG